MLNLKGEKPQHVYSVMFEAGELWGDAEFPGDKVLIDMFEDYLRPAGEK
jgi:Nitrile hydratase beta subunit